MSKISDVSCQFCGKNCICFDYGGPTVHFIDEPTDVPIPDIALTAAKRTSETVCDIS